MIVQFPAVFEIGASAADLFGVTLGAIFSGETSATVANARAFTMWAARKKYAFSYPELGRAFGRHESTCVTAVQKVERAIETGEPSRLADVARGWK